MERHLQNNKSDCLGIFLAMVLSLLLVTSGVAAEDPASFPTKPITMYIQWAAGGTTDLSGRKLADLAGKILGQPVVVENKVGGGGVIGTNAVAKAVPDGYTMGTFSNSPSVTVPHLRPVPYNVQTDFTYIMEYGEYAMIFCVLANSPWKTFKDFVEEARKKPGKMNYATPAPSGGQHIFMEQVFALEKVKLNHIPVTGGIEATRQLLGGHLDGAMTPDFITYIKAGQVRGLGSQTGKRVEWVPDISTFEEQGYKVQSINWMGLAGPKGIHPAILKKLSDAFKKAYEDPSFKALMASLYLPVVYADSESFREMVFKDFDYQGKVLKELGFAK
jgi:tripartite-type tricarboxylate transporter receptor subunit TctC